MAVDWWNRKITSCKISDAHPDYIPVSRRGDGIYKFSSNQSPEQLGSGSGGQRKDRWDTDERRHREASDPGPTSTSHGGGDCTDESIPKGLREPDRHCSSCSPLPPSSREGEESVAGAGDHRHDRDQTPSTALPRAPPPPTLADLLTTLKQKVATLQTPPSSPEAEEELAQDILAAATDTHRGIRRKILLQELNNSEFLTPSALAESEAEYRLLDRRWESPLQRREAQAWVRTMGYYVYEVLLGQVDDHEKDFEELEYLPDVT